MFIRTRCHPGVQTETGYPAYGIAELLASASRSSRPCRSRKRPTRPAMMCTSWVSAALVDAFTQRNRAAPSARSTYTPSRNNMWKWMLIQRTAEALLRPRSCLLRERLRRSCPIRLAAPSGPTLPFNAPWGCPLQPRITTQHRGWRAANRRRNRVLGHGPFPYPTRSLSQGFGRVQCEGSGSDPDGKHPLRVCCKCSFRLLRVSRILVVIVLVFFCEHGAVVPDHSHLLVSVWPGPVACHSVSFGD